MSPNNTVTSVAVLLDLEMAFEMASHLAILENLIHRGIRGKLLVCIGDKFSNSSARVGFHNHVSEQLQLENGIPQGWFKSSAVCRAFYMTASTIPVMRMVSRLEMVPEYKITAV